MSPKIEIVTVAASLTVTVPETVVEQNVGYLPWVLGENLAGQVDAWVMEQGLGYYPALDFFRDQPEAVDPALLLLIDEIAIFCAGYARDELRRRLSRAFSNVRIEQAQCTAYTLPRMRPARSGAPAGLAQHYSPGTVKMQLLLSSIQKEGAVDGLEELTLNKLMRWGRKPFEAFQINGSQLLPDG
ncbi:MAG: hypothetical protein OQK54_05890 [Gammaproteobacteria bacterium]|nr:hypothetical protein [Gammaproteobacteria bacterium]